MRTLLCWRAAAFMALLGPSARALDAQAATPAFLTLSELPDAPSVPRGPLQEPSRQTAASISGTVLDADGAEIKGAFVVLEDGSTHEERAASSGDDGSFTITELAPATYRITISAKGFAPWRDDSVAVHPGETLQLPQIELEIAPLTTSVDAVFTPYELAEDEIHVEEKQRVLGIVPNFYVTYNWHAAPLTSGQKFRLALRAQVDPFSFIGTGFQAAVEQASNSFSGYGQGSQGYALRYGAAYGDGFVGGLLGGAVLPSIFHQDPRYFYKGTGTISARALYAISTVFICRGDNGKWQPNYSNVLGTLAAAGISNAYYPSTDQDSGGVVVDNALIGLASGAFNSLMQEFVLRHIMLHSAPPPRSAPASSP